MRPWKFLLPLLATSLCFAAQPDRITGVIDSSQMVTLQNHVSPFATPQNDQGPVSASFPLRVTMLFTPTQAQQSALQTLLEQQQNRKSANYHKWLTPEQFADRFGLSANDIAKVTTWLQSQGLAVTYVARGRGFVSFSGTAAQVEAAFKTNIHFFEVRGEKHFANIVSPMIPAALEGIVGGFRGLHNFVPHRMNVRHYDYTLSGASTHFLAPGDIATIYDINPLYQASTPINGTGQKIAIVGQTDIYPADLTYFRTDFNLPGTINCTTNSSGYITSCNANSILQFVIPSNATDPGVNNGDLGESDLDLEWSGAVAPGATIIFVTSDLNSGGVSNSMSWAIDNDLAPVVSESYGLCEAYATPPNLSQQDAVFNQGASQGMSIFAASGDSAAAICDGDLDNNPSTATFGQSVSYPASDPNVTAVGGTEFNEGSGTYWNPNNSGDSSSALSYIPELAWNDSAASIKAGQGFDGTGGGPSNCENYNGYTTEPPGSDFHFNFCDDPPSGAFAKPTYQDALTPADSARDVPDLSFSASNVNDPYIVCTPQSQTNGSATTSTCVNGIATALSTYESAFGGTSVSTPVAAGMTVLLNQYLGTSKLGNINAELYQLFSSNPTAFHDIVAGTGTDGDTSNNVVPCTPNTPSFEPTGVQCPSGGTLGYSAAVGYDLVTGLGSIDFNVLFKAWAAALAPQFSLTVTPPTTASVSAGTSTTFSITVAPISGATPTVNFTSSSCSGLTTGATCSFSPASVTLNGTASQTVNVTIATSANMAVSSTAQTITITPTGSSINTTVSLTVTATTQSFTIAPTNGTTTYSVPAGQAASVQITVAGKNGFVISSSNTTALPLNYSCSGLPTEAICTFSPSQNSVSETALTVSISTTAPTSELRRPFDRGSRIFYAMLLPGVFGIVFAAGSRGRGARLLGLIIVLGLSTLWLGACGGSSSSSQNNPGTPPGSYTVTVNATTGAPVGGTALTGTFNVTLTVTQ
jgi:subtilase family serine protease